MTDRYLETERETAERERERETREREGDDRQTDRHDMTRADSTDRAGRQGQSTVTDTETHGCIRHSTKADRS